MKLLQIFVVCMCISITGTAQVDTSRQSPSQQDSSFNKKYKRDGETKSKRDSMNYKTDSIQNNDKKNNNPGRKQRID